MNESTFWDVVKLFDWDEVGDDDAVMEPACQALAAMDEESIFAFDDILSEKLHALDTREHCRACYAGELDPDNGDDYISADDFLYARCVVVANGPDLYAEVLADPTKFPPNVEFEALLSLPAAAYTRKTGEEYEHVPPVSYESFQNSVGWTPISTTRPGRFTDKNVPPGNRRPT
ncbi:MAG: DUF4240 domain-containing protein [Flavobacteriales bacterium]|nr:DUF4240 domain-containing protein [Flavobacteriales bacterium]